MNSQVLVMYKLLLILVLFSCGTWLDPWHKPKKSQGSVPSPIAQKLKLYCDLMKDPVHPTDGDSLFFTAYARTACNSGDLSDYKSRPGRYQRWPVSTGIKWDDPRPSGKPGTYARSEITRDGLLPVMWNAWARSDLKALEEIRDWGRSRDWFMGDGRLAGADTYFTPVYRQTLAEMIFKLGGNNDIIDRNLPANHGACEDFECWLTVTHILLRGEVFGHISTDALNSLHQALAHFPESPLYQWAVDKYTTGDSSNAVYKLIKAPWFPEDRLPTTADHCDEWPLRRNMQSKGLLPCPDNENKENPHSGGDWAFAAWLILRG